MTSFQILYFGSSSSSRSCRIGDVFYDSILPVAWLDQAGGHLVVSGVGGAPRLLARATAHHGQLPRLDCQHNVLSILTQLSAIPEWVLL